LRGSRRDTVCSGNTPPKRPYTGREPQMRAEQGFVRPYGIPNGVFAVLVEYRTVRHGQAKSGGILGDRKAPDGVSRRPTIEALYPYGGSSCAFANHQSPGKGEPHRRLRSGKPLCWDALSRAIVQRHPLVLLACLECDAEGCTKLGVIFFLRYFTHHTI